MKFKRHHITINHSEIHLLQYPEFDPINYLDNLNSEEINRLKKFSNIKRRREFVATRILKTQLFGLKQIRYNKIGSPFIDEDLFISISHSDKIVGIAVNKNHAIGLDLEPNRPNILRLKHKFLSDQELSEFNCESAKTVTQLWSAKETLYKLANRKQILFIEQLHLKKHENGGFKGTIINPDHKLSVKLDIFEFEGTFILINSEPVERFA